MMMMLRGDYLRHLSYLRNEQFARREKVLVEASQKRANV